MVRVKAVSNVLGLNVGDVAELPSETPDLADCLALGKLVQLDEQGNEIQRTVFRAASSCCGRRRG